MSKRQKMLLRKAIKFNPSEAIAKGRVSKKIPMGFLTEFQRKIKGFELSEYSSGPKFRNSDTLVAKITPCLENGKTAYVDILDDKEIAFGSSEFIVLRNTEFSDPEFIYYFARSPLFRERAISCMEGTSGRKRVNENTLKNFEFDFPILQDQQKIASVLSTLDAKIELNNKINAELEAMAKTLYDYWFVQFDFPDENGKPYKSSGGEMVWSDELKREIPKGWEVKTLLDIANFTNGLACQKHRPKDNDQKYRVIKIKEMNGGFSANSEYVTVNIPEKYIVNNGDVLFSWSATLDVKIWTGGIGGLNQHIFKITSEKYPKYYYYFELLNYLQHFKMMAELRKTTMGHITQEHLQQSIIVVPTEKILKELERIINPIFNELIKIKEENQKLIEIRDFLLPMLMNGQVVVK